MVFCRVWWTWQHSRAIGRQRSRLANCCMRSSFTWLVEMLRFWVTARSSTTWTRCIGKYFRPFSSSFVTLNWYVSVLRKLPLALVITAAGFSQLFSHYICLVFVRLNSLLLACWHRFTLNKRSSIVLLIEFLAHILFLTRYAYVMWNLLQVW